MSIPTPKLTQCQARGVEQHVRLLALIVLLAAACSAAAFIGQNGLAIFHWDDCEYLIGALDTFDNVVKSGYISWPEYVVHHQHYGKPPLYINSLAGALAITGRQHVTRAAALITGVNTLALGLIVYGLIGCLAGRRYGLLAAIAILGMPAIGVWATQTYPDMQLTCLVTCVLWLLAADCSRQRRTVGLGVLLGLGMLAKTTFPLFVALPLLYWAWHGGESVRETRDRFKILILAAAIGSLVASIWYIPNIWEALGYTRKYSTIVILPEMTRPERLWGWVVSITFEGIGYGLLSLAALSVVLMRSSGASLRSVFCDKFAVMAFLGAFPMAVLALMSSITPNSRHPLPSIVLCGLGLLVPILRTMQSGRTKAFNGVIWFILGGQWLVTCAFQVPNVADPLRHSSLAKYILPIAPSSRELVATPWGPVSAVLERAENSGENGPNRWYFYGNDSVLNPARLQLAAKMSNVPINFEYACLESEKECGSQLGQIRSTSAMVVLYARPWERMGGEVAIWNRHFTFVQAVLEDPKNEFHRVATVRWTDYSLTFYATKAASTPAVALTPVHANFGGQLLLVGAKLDGRNLLLRLKVLSSKLVNYKLLLRARETGLPSADSKCWDSYVQPPLTSVGKGESRTFSFILPEEVAERRFDLDIGFFDESDAAHQWPPVRLTTGEVTFGINAADLYPDVASSIH